MPVSVVNYIVSPGAGGKFVVLSRRDDPDSGLVLFSDFTRDFQHADIVRRWETGNKSPVAAAGYAVAGGGWWRLEGETLILYGQSAAYGRFSPDWLRARFVPGSLLAESRVDIR